MEFASKKNLIVLGCISSKNPEDPLDYQSIYPSAVALAFKGSEIKKKAVLNLDHLEDSFGLFTIDRVGNELNFYLCSSSDQFILINFNENKFIFERFKILKNPNFGIIYSLEPTKTGSYCGYSDKMESVVEIIFDSKNVQKEMDIGVNLMEFNFDNQFDITEFEIYEDQDLAILATRNSITSYEISENSTLLKQNTAEIESKFYFIIFLRNQKIQISPK